MDTQQLVAAIDAEIALLQQARALLSGTAAPKKRGRKPGQKTAAKAPSAKAAKKAKRTMSPEGRARIAAAQKARWAAQKKAAK